MPKPPRTHFSHIGIHVYDLETMIEFYTEMLGLDLTDRGPLDIPGRPEIAFLSSDPSEHHQVALAEGRNDADDPALVLNQVSFRVEDLDAVREMKAAVEEKTGAGVLCMSHGNAFSIYFDDPEGNAIEVFCGSPSHVRQPVTDPLDLTASDAEILSGTEAAYAGAADFGPGESWSNAFAARLEDRWR